MKSALLVLLFAAQNALAAQWAIDLACDGDDATNGIQRAMKGAVQRAKAAFKRMESADDLTHRAVQIIIGKDDDYDAKFNTIKGNFEAISNIPENPIGAVYLQRPSWRFIHFRDPNNIEFWCSADDNRFRQKENGLWQDITTFDASLTWEDLRVQQRKKCHANQPFVLTDDPNDDNVVNGEAVTARWETRIDKSKGYVEGNVREARRSASIDVCKFMRNIWNPKGWPIIDAAFVEKTRLPDEEKVIIDAWKVAFPGKPYVHLEALVTMEHTILHELFHTKHGGRKLDKGRGNIDCYGFSCVAKIHEAENADSLAYLGMMLQLLDWGYMVNEQGVIMKSEE